MFVGTYNPDGNGIIKDSTGARRYWFVDCKKIDIEAVMRDRDQLWAEAVANFEVGEQWWLEPHEEELAKVEQDARAEGDLWDSDVQRFLQTRLPGDPFTSRDVAAEMGIAIKDRGPREMIRIGKILSKLGCVPMKPYDESGKQYRAWAKPEN